MPNSLILCVLGPILVEVLITEGYDVACTTGGSTESWKMDLISYRAQAVSILCQD
jgi:hypothetical protein